MRFLGVDAACAAVIGLSLAASSAVAQQQRPPRAGADRPVTKAAGSAEVAPPAAPTGQAQPSNPQLPQWTTSCSSTSRQAVLQCSMDESAVLTRTGQVIVSMAIRVPSDTRSPVALIQLPLGVSVAYGVKLQIDDGKTFEYPIQTCEQRGCFVGTPVGSDLLSALSSGKSLKVSFQNLNKETLSLPLPLADFAAAFDKIK